MAFYSSVKILSALKLRGLLWASLALPATMAGAQANAPSRPAAHAVAAPDSAFAQAASVPTSPLPSPLPTSLLFDTANTVSAIQLKAGRLGTFDMTGIVSGFGVVQTAPVAGDRTARVDIGNGFVFLQKNSGWLQFFLQAGAYNIPIVGTTFISTGRTVSDFFGPLPVAYLKFAPSESFSILAGKLPSPVGPENTFDFQNLNIERGLLWNQENDIERGVQLAYQRGKFNGTLMWNDGYYSNRYNWLTGTFAFRPSPSNSLEFDAAGNLGRTGYSSAATPLYQNNSAIYALTYTHGAKRWLLQPYLQYTRVPQDTVIGVARATATFGGTVLARYNLRPHFYLSARAEAIGSSGNAADGSVNLLYGPGSRAYSFTLTPTYRKQHFFLWQEVSVVHAGNDTAGDAFGPRGNGANQVRGVAEAGFIF